MLVLILIVILLAYYYVVMPDDGPVDSSVASAVNSNVVGPIEGYKSCLNCDDDIRMLDGGNVVQNPYIWPYSGTADVGKIYQMNPEDQRCFGFRDEPLIHLNTPDHVILT